MKIFSIFFITFLFIKSFVYGLYELNNIKNKSGGIFILTASCLAFILSFISICIF